MNYASKTGQGRQTGGAAIEFALVVGFFLTFLFAVLELARVEYLANTLMEVTQRAASGAAKVSFHDRTGLQGVQANAIFRHGPGPLALGDPITDANVVIDYLSLSQDTGEFRHVTALPSCPSRNHWNCVANPYGDSCIRFVRARICASMDNAGNCQPLRFQRVFPFLDLSDTNMPVAETIVPAGNLGYTVGAMPCP